MAGQIIGGGGGYTGGSEDMSSPPGSEQDYCHDSKRKRKSFETLFLHPCTQWKS